MLILKDTREKNGWDFEGQDITVANRKLDTGDYTVEGIEEEFVIERKATVAEIAQNITTKWFKEEVKRMAGFRHAFFIFEFSWRDIEIFPVNSTIPSHLWKKIRISNRFLISCINTYRLKYGIQCITADRPEYAESVAFDLMKRYYENRNRSD